MGDKELWERLTERTRSGCLVRGSYSSKHITEAKVSKQAKDISVSIGLRSKTTQGTYSLRSVTVRVGCLISPATCIKKFSYFDYQA